MVFGAIEIFIALPLLVLFFRDQPVPSEKSAKIDGAADQPVAPEEAPLSLRQVMGMRVYWHLIASQVCISFCFLGITVHAVGIMTERGVEPATAVWGLSTFAAGGLAAKLVIGLLLDSIDTPRIIAPFALVSLISLLVIKFGHGEILGLSALFVFGFGCIACGPMAYLTTRYFGVRSFSKIYGSTVPIMTLLGAGSPVLAGLIYDLTGSYDLTLTAASFAMFAGFLLFLTLPLYRFRLKAIED
jgi:cyanate permease